MSKQNGHTSVAVAPARRVLSSSEIGQVAGDVWQLLADGKSRSPAAIKRAIDAPEVIVLAAIGWLAREDKLVFNDNGRYAKISLR